MQTNEEKIDDLLSRNVEEAIEKKHLKEALRGGKKLRVKLGIDPTSPDLHLGHAVVLKKLKAFQDLGHQIVLIIGDFTAQIGDPSGKVKTRPPLTEAEVNENMKNYLSQAAKIIDIKKTEIRYNGEWLKKMSIPELMKLLSLLSAQQILERGDFSKRIAAHESVRLHELLYPLMQAYDSVAIKADIECGGSDQIFNLLTGRTLMERLGLSPQDVLTVPLLVGLDGEKKMSKSIGNYIGLNESADQMFGKTMSVPDALMHSYFLLCTDLQESEIKKLEKEMGPRDLKAQLGYEIVKLYHGEKAAAAAREEFNKVFSKKEMPEDLPFHEVSLEMLSSGTVATLVRDSGVAKSNSEARRLVEQGALEIGGKVLKDPNLKLESLKLKGGEQEKIGKKHFFRIKIKD